MQEECSYEKNERDGFQERAATIEKETSRGFDKGNDKERFQAPRTKHLLHVHEGSRSDRVEGDKETRGPVIPFVPDASAHGRVPGRFMFLSTER